MELKGYEITLEPDELAAGEACGRLMRSESLKNNLKDKHGFEGDGELAIQQHITSECGAIAAGIIYGVPWECRVNTFKKKADLGKRTEVRTLRGWDFDLIIRDDDPVEFNGSEANYVLVIGQWPNPTFRVVGHIGARAGKAREKRPLKNTREWVYRISQDELKEAPGSDNPRAKKAKRTEFEQQRFILRHEGDYVARVESTGWETVKIYFVFSKKREDAKVFSHQDLFWKQATNPIGIQFAQGFSRGELITVD